MLAQGEFDGAARCLAIYLLPVDLGVRNQPITFKPSVKTGIPTSQAS